MTQEEFFSLLCGVCLVAGAGALWLGTGCLDGDFIAAGPLWVGLVAGGGCLVAGGSCLVTDPVVVASIGSVVVVVLLVLFASLLLN